MFRIHGFTNSIDGQLWDESRGTITLTPCIPILESFEFELPALQAEALMRFKTLTF